MFCESCEQELPPGALVCPQCGVATAWSREVKREPYLRAAFLIFAVIFIAGLVYLIVTRAEPADQQGASVAPHTDVAKLH